MAYGQEIFRHVKHHKVSSVHGCGLIARILEFLWKSRQIGKLVGHAYHTGGRLGEITAKQCHEPPVRAETVAVYACEEQPFV